MTIGRMRGVVGRLRQTVLTGGNEASDAELLQRFLTRREDSAFAALVRRHGPMVLAACRRILGNVHDADDAFQATFLVLVRRAHVIVPRERVGAWLHGVAVRTSTKAKAMSLRRRAKQKPLQDVAGAAGPAPADSDWLALLDREIQRLPEKYRLPVVLCDLEGKTRKQAARELGCPEGTVATRLQHARALVHKRLARHGVPLAAGAFALAWAQAVAAAGLPAPLAAGAVKTASLFMAGKVAGLIPLNILALAQGVLQAMVLSKVKNVSASLFLLTVLAVGLGALAGDWPSAAGAQPGPDEPPNPPARRTTPQPPSVVSFVDSGTVERNDSRLPIGPTPEQALVSLVQDVIVVRTSRPYYEPVTSVVGGRPVTSYRLVANLHTSRYDQSAVEVCDTRRRKLDHKDLASRLKNEIPALVLFGSRDIDPLHLRLIKEDTLILSVPVPAVVGTPPTTVPAVTPWGPDLRSPPPLADGSLNPPQPAPTPPSIAVPQSQGPPIPLQTGPTPLSVPPQAPTPQTRIDQAERDLNIAEFYLRRGHPSSATFYYELIRRRYAGTTYAQQAERFLADLRGTAPTKIAAGRPKDRVGEIFIVGNRKVPDEAIRDNLPLYPGQVLNYKDLRAAEEKLRSLDAFVQAGPLVNIRPTITVLDSGPADLDAHYKDILITVQESLRLDVLEELKKLEGSWIVTSVTFDGKAAPPMVSGEFIFAGDRLTMVTKERRTRSTLTIDPAKKPGWIRISPQDGAAGRSVGDYEISGDELKLSLRTGSDNSHAGVTGPVMQINLRRKRPDAATAAAPVPAAREERAFRIEDVATGRTITADAVAVLPDGRVMLKSAVITRARQGDSAAERIHADQIILTMATPVRTLSDLGGRAIIAIDLPSGTVHQTK